MSSRPGPRAGAPRSCATGARRDKVSVISGLSVSPVRPRMGLYYRCSLDNIGQAEAVAFLRHLLRPLRGPVIVLFDNARIHTAAQVRALAQQHPRLHLSSARVNIGLEIGSGVAHSRGLMRHLALRTEGWWWPPQ